ncbi:MAG: MBL fold metallo-hydrolase [Vicinamibacterales bacterium]
MTRGHALIGFVIVSTLLSPAPLAQAPVGAPPQGAVPGGAPQGAPPAPAMLQVQKLKDNLFVISGGGGNTTVFVTRNNGVVVIDTKLAGNGPALLDAIRSITPEPVATVINSHSHADHTGNNPGFPPAVRVVSHVNTRANMQKMEQFQGANAAFVPTHVFQDRLTLFTGPDRIELYYFGQGGTNGDAWIVIPAHRVMIGADNFNQGLTLIDTANGGSARRFEQTLTRVASEIRDVDTVITGHGGVLSWNDFLQFSALTKEFYAWARAQKAAGKTVEQAAMDYRLPAQYVGFAAPNPMFMQRILQVVFSED